MTRPNTDLVGVAWLKLVPGLDPQKVATKLPTSNGEVSADALRPPGGGFVRWHSGLGGTPSGVMRRPVGAAECWAAPAPGSSQVPWGRASELAEAIMDAVDDEHSPLHGITVTLPGDYGMARVHSVNALGEPVKVEGDPSGFARFDLDLEINWTRSD
jgi:hypothetical protein